MELQSFNSFVLGLAALDVAAFGVWTRPYTNSVPIHSKVREINFVFDEGASLSHPPASTSQDSPFDTECLGCCAVSRRFSYASDGFIEYPVKSAQQLRAISHHQPETKGR